MSHSAYFLKILCQLVEARSRLYRRRFLQVNTRWKALDEIYNISVPLHRSKLNIFRKFHQNVDEISRNIRKILHVCSILSFFEPILMKFSWNFTTFHGECKMCLESAEILQIS